jgi:hypothetical protein
MHEAENISRCLGDDHHMRTAKDIVPDQAPLAAECLGVTDPDANVSRLAILFLHVYPINVPPFVFYFNENCS